MRKVQKISASGEGAKNSAKLNMFYDIFTTYFDVFLDVIDGEKWTIEILPKVPNLVVRKIYVAFLRYVAFRTYVRPPRPDRLP